MADKTQINLERIRACDADWNENDHPRADNGQFTSGSGGGGAKVSKLQSGGKAKVQQLKNVSSALAGVNAGKAAAPAAKPSLQKLQQAMYNESMMKDRAWLHLDGQDYVKIGKDKWEHHPSNSHALGGTYSSQQMMEKIGKAKKVDLYEPSAAAKPAKAAQPAPKPQPKAAKPEKSIEQLENEYKDAFNRYVAFTENAKGLHDLYRNPEIYKQAMQMAKQKAIKAEKAYMKASDYD